MSALQLKYFGKRRRGSSRRVRRSSSARRGRRSIVIMNANPRGRRRRRSSVRSFRRRYRRNPIASSAGGLRFSLRSATYSLQCAAVGGLGAVVADVAYAQALRFAPENVVANIGSRYSENGGANLAYYGAKLGLAFGLGVLASNFIPGRMGRYVAQATEGALTVGAYELIRLMMPANIALAAYTGRRNGGMGRMGRLGYMNPAQVSANMAEGRTLNSRRLSAYTGARRLSGLRGTNSAGSLQPTYYSGDTRVGEGAML